MFALEYGLFVVVYLRLMNRSLNLKEFRNLLITGKELLSQLIPSLKKKGLQKPGKQPLAKTDFVITEYKF